MATVLVALMAFAVQSCGSDDKDDLSSSPYEIIGTFSLQQIRWIAIRRHKKRGETVEVPPLLYFD